MPILLKGRGRKGRKVLKEFKFAIALVLAAKCAFSLTFWPDFGRNVRRLRAPKLYRWTAIKREFRTSGILVPIRLHAAVPTKADGESPRCKIWRKSQKWWALQRGALNPPEWEGGRSEGVVSRVCCPPDMPGFGLFARAKNKNGAPLHSTRLPSSTTGVLMRQALSLG